MTVEELIIYGKSFCHSTHVKFLLADLLNLNPLELLNHLNDFESEEKIELFKKEVKSLEEGKPLQYVIGNVNFFGNRFMVDERVLIPRFETEELVENTIKYAKELFDENISILDIGCGSGAIGLTLKKELTNSSVDLVDISKEALDVAKQNAKNLNIDANFIESDVFENVNKKYDIIISNPPYIKEDEEIEEIVKNNEPHIALYAGVDGLDIYKRIFLDVKNYINDKYLIALEIGMTQTEDIIKLANTYLDNIIIEVKKDLSEKDRMIFIIRK